MTSVVFCFITLGSPLAAAFAIGYAAQHIENARRLKRAYENSLQLFDIAKKYPGSA